MRVPFEPDQCHGIDTCVGGISTTKWVTNCLRSQAGEDTHRSAPRAGSDGPCARLAFVAWRRLHNNSAQRLHHNCTVWITAGSCRESGAGHSWTEPTQAPEFSVGPPWLAPGSHSTLVRVAGRHRPETREPPPTSDPSSQPGSVSECGRWIALPGKQVRFQDSFHCCCCSTVPEAGGE